MAQIWSSADSGWLDTPLLEQGYEIRGAALGPAHPGSAAAPSIWRIEPNPDRATWVLVSPPTGDVRVNGESLVNGLRVLEDRDLIQIEDGPALFYSTDTATAPAPLPDLDRRVVCPRCKKEITPGTPAVQCPRCHTFHHQDEADDRLCWTYAETCFGCDHHTDLELDTRWTPEEL